MKLGSVSASISSAIVRARGVPAGEVAADISADVSTDVSASSAAKRSVLATAGVGGSGDSVVMSFIGGEIVFCMVVSLRPLAADAAVPRDFAVSECNGVTGVTVAELDVFLIILVSYEGLTICTLGFPMSFVVQRVQAKALAARSKTSGSTTEHLTKDRSCSRISPPIHFGLFFHRMYVR